MPKASSTAILEKEGDLYVALCPELDVASQGPNIEEATANLKEAVELFLECADPTEIEARQYGEVFPPVPANIQARTEGAQSCFSMNGANTRSIRSLQILLPGIPG